MSELFPDKIRAAFGLGIWHKDQSDTDRVFYVYHEAMRLEYSVEGFSSVGGSSIWAPHCYVLFEKHYEGSGCPAVENFAVHLVELRDEIDGEYGHHIGNKRFKGDEDFTAEICLRFEGRTHKVFKTGLEWFDEVAVTNVMVRGLFCLGFDKSMLEEKFGIPITSHQQIEWALEMAEKGFPIFPNSI